MTTDQLGEAALSRAIESRDWDAFDRIVGNTPEEIERILREETFVDAAELNRRMEELDAQDDQLANQNIVALRMLVQSLSMMVRSLPSDSVKLLRPDFDHLHDLLEVVGRAATANSMPR